MEGIFVYVLEYMLTLDAKYYFNKQKFEIWEQSILKVFDIFNKLFHIVRIVLHIGCSGPVTRS